jgi:hypothetical protein
MRPDFDTLEAVNHMLRAADETEVNTLNNDGVNDTDLAQKILDEKIMEVLAEGWSFNTEVQTLTPDNTNRIAISTGIIRVDGYGDDYYSNFTVRGGYLYDRDNSTNEFTVDSVELQVVRWLEFEDIPLTARLYIAASAAREFQQRTNNDPNADALLAEKEAKALGNLKRESVQESDWVWGVSKNSSTKHIRRRRRRDPRR